MSSLRGLQPPNLYAFAITAKMMAVLVGHCDRLIGSMNIYPNFAGMLCHMAFQVCGNAMFYGF